MIGSAGGFPTLSAAVRLPTIPFDRELPRPFCGVLNAQPDPNEDNKKMSFILKANTIILHHGGETLTDSQCDPGIRFTWGPKQANPRQPKAVQPRQRKAVHIFQSFIFELFS
jgi:hypothetical protein